MYARKFSCSVCLYLHQVFSYSIPSLYLVFSLPFLLYTSPSLQHHHPFLSFSSLFLPLRYPLPLLSLLFPSSLFLPFPLHYATPSLRRPSLSLSSSFLRNHPFLSSTLTSLPPSPSPSSLFHPLPLYITPRLPSPFLLHLSRSFLWQTSLLPSISSLSPQCSLVSCRR